MTGIIWFVQVVHYPLFSSVGGSAFAAYQAGHTRLTTWVVAPLMLLELATALLLFRVRPPGATDAALWLGLVLLAVVWASTFFLQVPRHELLATGFDAAAHRALVLTNWLRTGAWSARAALVLWLAARAWN